MQKKALLSLLALVFFMSTSVAMAQPASMRAVQNKHQAQLTRHMIEGDANMCAINAHYDGNLNSGPCRRALSPMAEAIYARAGAQIAYADIITRLPGVHHGFGFGNRRWHGGYGGWFERGRDGRWSNDRFGKFDDAELWGTLGGIALGGYQERNRHKEEMERIRMQDKHTPDADVPATAQTQAQASSSSQPQVVEVRVVHEYPDTAPQTQSAPLTQQSASTLVRSVINRTGTEVQMLRDGRNPFLIDAGTTIDVVARQGEEARFRATKESGCTVKATTVGNSIVLTCR